MNYAARALKTAEPINLARESDFIIGGLQVRPSLREMEAGGKTQPVEPRVLQVLIALFRSEGAVVSREDLIERCWGGRIVGEDAINSCISKVRSLANLAGEPPFEIETIPRVGYRLRQKQRDTQALPQQRYPTEPHASTSLESGSSGGRWRWTGLAIAAIAIAGILATALYFSLRREPEWIVVESHLPFISTPAIERYPALAPDGTMLAYSAGPLITDRQIYLRLLKGGDPIQLTHDSGDASSPAWSPDGKIIAYVAAEQGHPCRMMEVPVPAGQARQVGQCRVSDRSSLSFDRSGRALFFADGSARGIANRIFKLDLDNGRISSVTHSKIADTSDGEPSISPDGRTVLYNRTTGAVRSEIRLVSLGDGDDRLVAGFDNGDANANWSSDGRTIFIARSQGDDNTVLAYPVQGGEAWRVLTSGEYIGRLSAGPNGLLAMEMQYPGGQLVAVTPHSGLPAKPIDSNGLRTWCVDYAPDGTFLATGWHSESFGIWISDARGGLRELLRLPDSQACAIRWSPDGTRFAFVQRRGNGFDVPVMTRSGEPIARLHYAGDDSGVLDWTPDGRSILTSQKEQRGWRIWRTDLANPGKSVPITPYGWRDPRVHQTMLFAEKNGAAGIWRIDGAPRRMADGPAPAASDVYNIAGDRLIYSDTTDPEHPMFSAQGVNGGPKDRLAPLPHGQVNFTFGVDPKSGDIVYTQGTDDTDIGLLRLVKR